VQKTVKNEDLTPVSLHMTEFTLLTGRENQISPEFSELVYTRFDKKEFLSYNSSTFI